MSALEAARSRALAAVQRRKNKSAQATKNQSSDNATAAAASLVTAGAGATIAAAAASVQPTDAAIASAAAVESPTTSTRRRPRKRRFDILPSDQLVGSQGEPISSALAQTATAAPAYLAAAAAFAAPLASAGPDHAAATLPTDTHSVVPHSTADATQAASATPAAPAAAAASLTAAAANEPAGSTTSVAAGATKRSRWAPSVVAGAPTGATSVPTPADSLGALAASHADSTALVVPSSSAARSGGDHAVSSSALVSLDGGGEGSATRRSRFSPAAAPPPWDAAALSWDAPALLALHPTHVPAGVRLLLLPICAGMSLGAADAMLARMRLDAIEAQLRALAAGRPLDEVDPRPTDAATGAPRARSPSPEPVYDSQGKRTNTRPQRLRTTLLALQHSIVTATLARSPADFKPPKGFRSSAAGRLKFERKLPIPLDEYPDYNFKGVIIGARGLKQQELQARTGCKIAVRGRGSWSSSRPDSMRQRHADDDEPQHCWIQADTPEALERGVAEVSKLLVPMSDEARRRSLQELAELNGWVREPQACRVCGATDHLMKACPDRNGGRGFLAAAVSCKLCGARTHPALDCPSARGLSRDEVLRRMRSAGARDADQRVDDEYEHFMAELMGEEGATLGSAGGGASKRLLLTSGDGSGNSHGLSSSSLVARGSDGVQLCLLPPTSREEHRAAQQHSQLQQQIKAESFREYTPRDAAAHTWPTHPSSHPSAPATGWATHELVPSHAHQHASYAHATPLPPPPPQPQPPPFVPPYPHQPLPPHPHLHPHPHPSPPLHYSHHAHPAEFAPCAPAHAQAHAIVPHDFPYATERFQPPPPGI